MAGRSKDSEKQLDEAESDWSETEEHISCRKKLAHVLHSAPVHWTVIFLVIIDGLIVVATILIDFGVIQAPVHANNSAHDGADTQDGSNDVDIVHKVEMYLHYTSIGILSLFVIEVLLKIYALGTMFFNDAFEIFDAIVIFVSFAIDIAITFEHVQSVAMDVASLTVLLRLWRITRIVNSAIVSIKTKAEAKIDIQKKARRKAEMKIEDLEERVKSQQKEIEELEIKLHKLTCQVTQNETSLDDFAAQTSSLILEEAAEEISLGTSPKRLQCSNGSVPSLDKISNENSDDDEMKKGKNSNPSGSKDSSLKKHSQSEIVEQNNEVKDKPAGSFAFENPAFVLQETNDLAEDLAGLRKTVENDMLEDFQGDVHYYTNEDGIPMTSL